MKKKIVTLALAGVLALAAVGCGSSNETTETVSSEAAVVESVPEEVESVAEEVESVVEEAVESIAEEVEEAEAVPQRGVIEGNLYTSEFFGFTLTLPEGWAFATEDEMAQISQVSADLLNDESAAAEALANGTVFTDVYAYSGDGLQNLNVTIQSLGVFGGLTDVAASIDTIADVTREQFGSSGLELENVSVASYAVDVNGESLPALKISFTTNGIECFETMAIKQQGNYISFITGVSYLEDTSEAVLTEILG